MASYDANTRFESQLLRISCQTFSTGFSSGHLAGSATMVMFGGTMSRLRDMPASLIDQQGTVLARRDPRGDFGQVQAHGLGVAPGQNQTCRGARHRADRAENVGRRRTLILRR